MTFTKGLYRVNICGKQTENSNKSNIYITQCAPGEQILLLGFSWVRTCSLQTVQAVYEWHVWLRVSFQWNEHLIYWHFQTSYFIPYLDSANWQQYLQQTHSDILSAGKLAYEHGLCSKKNQSIDQLKEN